MTKEFKITVTCFDTSKAHVMCVKIPENKHINDYKKDLPAMPHSVLGESHKLIDDQINMICKDRKEFYNVFGNNDIYYNWSAWTGKWIVMYTLINT